MAKYKLARTTKGMHTTECAILNENCEAGTYLVQFDNGIIKDVPKYNVYDLDKIDEGVLDKLRALAEKAKKSFGNVFKRIFDTHVEYNIGKVGVIDWVSLMAQNAKKLPFIKAFYPSDSYADAHDDITVEVVEDQEETVDGEFIKNMEAMFTVVKQDWEEYVNSNFDKEKLQDAIEHYDDMMFSWNRFQKQFATVRESVDAGSGKAINEAEDGGIQLAEPGMQSVSATEAVRIIQTEYKKALAISNLIGKPFNKKEFVDSMLGSRDENTDRKVLAELDDLRDMYMSRSYGVADGDVVKVGDINNIMKGFSYSVLMFWGAPGVGKSRVISDAIKSLTGESGGSNMVINGGSDREMIISLNALGMRKDDISYPVLKTETKKGSVTTPDGKSVQISYTQQVPVDITKPWFPGWDSITVDAIMGENPNLSREDVIKELDNIANGGRMAVPAVVDANGNTVVEAQDRVEGQGGIIFVDELSRIDGDVMNSFMTMFQSRKINTMTLGSKWIFVCAGNRFGDMGEGQMADAVRENWEKAWNDRTKVYCFVPSFDDWLSWARNGNVPRWITDFLSKNKEMWYNSSTEFRFKENEVYNSKYMKGAGINGRVKEQAAMFLFPNPRQWELAGQAYADLIMSGFSPEDAKKRALNATVGAKTMDYFFDKDIMRGFNDEDAENVIDYGFDACETKGVPVVDQTEALGINVHASSKNSKDNTLNYKGMNVLSKIFSIVKKRHSAAENDKILSPNAFNNIVEYIYCCCIYIAMNGGAAAGSHVFRNCQQAMQYYIDDIYGEGSWDNIVKQGVLPGSQYNKACERMQKLANLTNDALLASQAEEEYKTALENIDKN